MRYRVIMTPAAIADVQQAEEWIAERSPQGARGWLAGFDSAITALETAPECHALALEASALQIPLREFLYQTKSSTTRILYVIEGDEVQILRVRRPGQDLLRGEDLQ